MLQRTPIKCYHGTDNEPWRFHGICVLVEQSAASSILPNLLKELKSNKSF